MFLFAAIILDPETSSPTPYLLGLRLHGKLCQPGQDWSNFSIRTHVSGYPGYLEVIGFVARVSIKLGIIEVPFDCVKVICLEVITAVEPHRIADLCAAWYVKMVQSEAAGRICNVKHSQLVCERFGTPTRVDAPRLTRHWVWPDCVLHAPSRLMVFFGAWHLQKPRLRYQWRVPR